MKLARSNFSREYSPHFSHFWARGFEFVLHRLRRLHLEGIAVRFASEWHAPEGKAGLSLNQPLLFIANHAGNWDGFLLRALQKRLRPASPIFSIMLESELKQRPIFRRIGGIGIEPGKPSSTRKLLRDLKVLRKLHPQMAVSLFPQGRLAPAWHSLQFESGALAIAKALLPAMVVPVALRYECLQGLKPTALMAVQAPLFCENEPPTLDTLLASVADGLAELGHLVAEKGDTLAANWSQVPHSEWWKS